MQSSRIPERVVFCHSIRFPQSFPVLADLPGIPLVDWPVRRLHIHNGLEIGCCQEGSGVFIAGGKMLPYRTGDITVVTDREVHMPQTSQGVRSVFSWVVADPAGLLASRCDDHALLDTAPFAGPGFPNVLSPERYPRICRAVTDIFAELTGRRPGYRDAVAGLFLVLLAELHRAFGTNAAGRSPAPVRDYERVSPAIDHMRSRYSQPIRVAELAAMCCMSTTHFGAVFSRALKRSPQQYLVRLRVAMACARLRSTGESISRIAGQCGFPTLSCFNRMFRKVMGQAPREWRKAWARVPRT